MPEFAEKSGMTFAKKDISSAWNLPKRKLINTPSKHRPHGDVNWTWTATWATTYPIWATTQDIHGDLAGLTSRSEGVGDGDNGVDDGGAPWFLQKQKPYKLSLIHAE